MPVYPQKRKRKGVGEKEREEETKKGRKEEEIGAMILSLFLKIFKHVSQDVACFNEIALSPSIKF